MDSRNIFRGCQRAAVVSCFLLATLAWFEAPAANAASMLSKITCGGHAQGEFTEARQQHLYEIPMTAGSKLNVRIVPFGKVLRVKAVVFDPVDIRVVDTDNLSTEVTFDAGPLSANGIHKILIQNYKSAYRSGAVGLYDIYIKCVDRAGQTTEAGSVGGSPAGTVPPGAAVPQGGAVSGLSALDQSLSNLSQTPELSKYAEDVQKVQSYARIAKEAAGVVQVFKGMFGNKKRKKQEQEIQELKALLQQQLANQAPAGMAPAQPIYQGPGANAAPPVGSGQVAGNGAAHQGLPSVAPASARDSGVTLFAQPSFAGADSHYAQNQADLSDSWTASTGVVSVRLTPGCMVLLYAQPGFEGPATMLDVDTADLRPSVSQTQVRSLRVRCE